MQNTTIQNAFQPYLKVVETIFEHIVWVVQTLMSEKHL